MTARPPDRRAALPPLLTRTDADGVLAAVAAEGWPVDLRGAVLHEEGYENLVLRTADGWIVRFPRREEPDFAREVAVLGLLAGRLPVPVPRVERTGRHHRCLLYRTLTGHLFDADAWAAAGEDERDGLADSLAGIMAAMHSALSPAEVAALGLPTGDPAADVAALRAGADGLPDDVAGPVREVADELGARWVADPPDEPVVVLHNDLHLRNAVLAAPVGPVTGLWDFSCVQLGRPTEDLRYLLGQRGLFPCRVGRTDLARRVAERYAARTGVALDLDRAAVRLRAEDLLDALHPPDDVAPPDPGARVAAVRALVVDPRA